MSDVPAKHVGAFEQMREPGTFMWHGEPPVRMTFKCPCGCGAAGGVAVRKDENVKQEHPVWQWNGDRDRPTIHPSIRFLGGCEWHGYLTDGVFRSC